MSYEDTHYHSTSSRADTKSRVSDKGFVYTHSRPMPRTAHPSKLPRFEANELPPSNRYTSESELRRTPLTQTADMPIYLTSDQLKTMVDAICSRLVPPSKAQPDELVAAQEQIVHLRDELSRTQESLESTQDKHTNAVFHLNALTDDLYTEIDSLKRAVRSLEASEERQFTRQEGFYDVLDTLKTDTKRYRLDNESEFADLWKEISTLRQSQRPSSRERVRPSPLESREPRKIHLEAGETCSLDLSQMVGADGRLPW